MDYCDPSSGRRPPAPQAAKEAGSELAAPETEDADEAPTGAAAPGGAEAARREAGAPASAAAAASAGAAAAPRAAPWLAARPVLLHACTPYSAYCIARAVQ
jgi:hypothetical protein